MADALRNELGVEVEVAAGHWGELSVAVDGRVVARKKLLLFKPSVETVLMAVRNVMATPTRRRP